MNATDEEYANQPVSHGICKDCASKILTDMHKTLEGFINRFSFPILVVNNDAALIEANRAARVIHGRKLELVKGVRAGDIIECAHSFEKGGCGRTIHCRACTIRNSVKQTFLTGQATIKVPATADVFHGGEVNKVQFFITTEKIGDFVALKIEDANAPSRS
jgi:hypothetical protein